MPRIPSEISDAIIDHLHADTPTLKLCALVCKRWLPSSRFHLFRAIALHPYNYHKFFAAMESSEGTLALYIRHLTLSEGTAGLIAGREWVEEPGVLSRLAKLPEVRTLRIEGMSWDELKDESRKHFAGGFPKLADLMVRFTCFSSFKQLLEIICGHQHLTKLGLERVWCGGSPIGYPLHLIPPKHLQSLHLMNYDNRIYLDWLATGEDISSLRSVSVNLFLGQYPSTGRFLRALGPSLQRLQLGFYTGCDAAPEEELDLSRNIGLRTIRFNWLSGIPQDRQWLAVDAWIPVVLKQLSSASIAVDEIIFSDWPWLRHDFLKFYSRECCLSGLDSALDGFPSLRKVSFMSRRDEERGAWKDHIKVLLSSSSRRGVLEFSAFVDYHASC